MSSKSVTVVLGLGIIRDWLLTILKCTIKFKILFLLELFFIIDVNIF